MSIEPRSTNLMGQGHDILIIKRADDLPDQIQERLHAEGYATVATPDLKDVHRKLDKLKDPIVLVETGVGTTADISFAKKLLTTEALYKCPLVLVGKGASSLEKTLTKSKAFVLPLAVPSPGTAAQLMRTLRDAAELIPQARSGSTPSAIEPQERSAPVSIPIMSDERPANVPELLFQQLKFLSVKDAVVGGDQYSSAINLESLRHQGYLPHDSKVASVIETICADAGKWGRNHLCRVAYLTCRLAEALKFPEELRPEAKKGAFLFAWSFAGEREDLLRKNYLKDGYSNLRRDLCSKLKDSALKVSSELGYPVLTNALAKFARFVGKEEPVTDDASSLLASAIMGADIVDRVCFHSGYWDSRAAYTLMNKFKTGRLVEMHPAVMCCLIKIISETIATNPSIILLPKRIRQDPELLERARKIRDEEPEEGEAKVEISDLSPGMRLSRPLFAFDGRQILEEDLTLDQDLVWRIWQLSAIRPLNAPLVVKKARENT